MFESIIALAAGLIILALVTKIISVPFKLLWKFIVNSVVGALMLAVLKFMILTSLQINILTALIAGIFGIPGVLAIALYSYI
ncbi:pro-sigmaK processing inhibitor BofA family protein [Selenomonas sp. TAMA-11512]|uniref:pro-sigmaK processing inhibitor BofA family protein n=1 Tax=Selenomonas sp. TAMA-11512 TaxID=3095337 RepID=UPI0030892254|nr:pro-sigmaK processing inhibitor BofA family protein [Selenomonas sp. TAMA-11512]